MKLIVHRRRPIDYHIMHMHSLTRTLESLYRAVHKVRHAIFDKF